LLHDMSQFVCEQRISYQCAWPILTRRECHVASDRERSCIQVARQRCRPRICVYPNTGKVMSQRPLHSSFHTRVERLAGPELAPHLLRVGLLFRTSIPGFREYATNRFSD
jgi:hypothetical protein